MTWRSSVALSVIAAVVPLIGLISFPSGKTVFIARWLGAAWALALLAWLFTQRRPPRLSLVRIAFALTAAPFVPMSWLVTVDRVAQGAPAELFIREVAVSLVLAVVTPPRALISVVAIALLAVANVLIYRTGTQHAWGIWGWQPWASLLYAGLATGIALLQARRQRREIAFIVEIERLSALERMLRSHAALRDLVNTPLQTLRLALDLLGARHPDAMTLVERMDRAVDRLDELNRFLEAEARESDARLSAESLDAVTVLRTSATARGRKRVVSDGRRARARRTRRP